MPEDEVVPDVQSAFGRTGGERFDWFIPADRPRRSTLAWRGVAWLQQIVAHGFSSSTSCASGGTSGNEYHDRARQN